MFDVIYFSDPPLDEQIAFDSPRDNDTVISLDGDLGFAAAKLFPFKIFMNL